MSAETIVCNGPSIHISARTNAGAPQTVTVYVGKDVFTFRGVGESNTLIGSKTISGPATIVVDVRSDLGDSKTRLELRSHSAKIESEDRGDPHGLGEPDYDDCIVDVVWGAREDEAG